MNTSKFIAKARNGGNAKSILGFLSPFALPRFRDSFVSAINDTAAAALAAIGAVNEKLGAQDWIRITPFGEFPNKVGLQVLDRTAADAMVGSFNSMGTKLATLWQGLPIYEGHPDDPEWQKKNPGVRAVAVGRVKELQVRDDGLYGRVAFNALGKRS
jgi:hypothetical protein